jgi:hypothetical protein
VNYPPALPPNSTVGRISSKSDSRRERIRRRVRRLICHTGDSGGSDHNELASETETLLHLEINVTKKDAMSFERVVELALPIVALLISGLALWQSSEAQSRTTAPNVQIVSVKSTDRAYLQRRDQNGQDTGEYYSLAGSVKIKNYGDASIQLISVKWEPITTATNTSPETVLLLSDSRKFKANEAILPEAVDSNFDPVLGLDHRTFAAGETKTIDFFFRGRTDMWQGRDIYSLRIVFTMSNGQELSVVPEYEYTPAGK